MSHKILNFNKLQKINPDKPFRWIYIGSNYGNVIKLRRQFGENNEIGYGEYLQQKADELKGKFVDLIGKLNQRYPDVAFYINRVSEKSIFHDNNIFESICRIEALERVLKLYKQDSVYVIVDNALIYSFLIDGYPEKSAGGKLSLAYFICRKAFFRLYSNIKNKTIIKRLLKRSFPAGQVESYIIRTWLDGQCLDKNNDFRDIHFGRLGDYLRSKNKRVLVLPYILNYFDTKKIIESLIAKNKIDEFVFFEEILTIYDIACVFLKSVFLRLKFKDIVFENRDYTRLFQLYADKHYYSGSLEFALKHYYLIKRLYKKNFKICAFIYPFENQPWEKILCLAVKKYFPAAKLKGYLHSVLTKYYLFYYLSKYDKELLPQPDEIITSGPMVTELLKQNNFKAQIKTGCALRYEYLYKKKLEKKINSNIVLVTLSINLSKSVEMLYNIFKEYMHKRDIEVWIKFHPMTIFKMKDYGLTDLPAHFKIVNDSLNILLAKVDRLIFSDSTTCCEAVVRGINIKYLKSDYNINTHPFDIIDNFENKSLQDLEIKVKDLLQPVTDKSMDVFLN